VRANGARQLSKGELIRAAEVAVVNRFVLQREHAALLRRRRAELAAVGAFCFVAGVVLTWLLR